jgi:hypothetical protein
MAANIAIAAFGTKLQRGDGGAPEGFVTISDQIEFDIPELERAGIEVTHAESPGSWAEFISAGVKQLNSFSLTINYKPTEATHNATLGVIADWAAGAVKNYKLLFPDASAWTFGCIVLKFKPQTGLKDQLKAQITYQPTGQSVLV